MSRINEQLRNSRVAIVTGAGSGIGRAVTVALAADGWHVVLAGRRETALAETTALIDGTDTATLIVPTDVAEEAAVVNLFAAAVNQFGRVDLLFNNAGVNVPTVPIEELSLQQWQKVVDVNLTGMFLCTREAVRQMKSQTPQGGRIINNGSISSQVPRPNSAPYTATKHAVTGLTKSTALDGRDFHIACGQIDIGNTATEMAANMKEGVPQADGSIKVEPTFDVAHVAATIVQMANLPLEANVLQTTILASGMPFVGRVNSKIGEPSALAAGGSVIDLTSARG